MDTSSLRLMQNDSLVQRQQMVDHARAELHANHRSLTQRQVDLIADVVAELRMAHVRIEGEWCDPNAANLHARVRRSA